VLLVDDNAANRRLVAAILEPFAIDLETACDGVEAVAASARRDFDVILMDVQMPNMDGLSATARIRASSRAEERTTPIIAMTANVADDQVRRCLAAGMDDHVGKPIAPHQLLSILERWGSERSHVSQTPKTPRAAETAALGAAGRPGPRAG
jgi:CheY-like chemotaxis protein